MTFQDQYKHPKWQKKRLEVLEANDFECVNCTEKNKQLHVHHPVYRKGAKLWEYETDELQCLCEDCHKAAHKLKDDINEALLQCMQPEIVLGFIKTLNAINEAENGDPASLRLESYEDCEGAYGAISIAKRKESFKAISRICDVAQHGGGLVTLTLLRGRNKAVQITA